MSARRIATERLVLVTATSQHLLVELEDVEKLGKILGATVPAQWPPSGGAEPDLRALLGELSGKPARADWRRRYVVLTKSEAKRPVLVGHLELGGQAEGGSVTLRRVDLVEEHRGRGIEKEAAGGIVDWVMGGDTAQRVVTAKPDDPGALIGIWDELGFTVDGETLVRTREGWLADGPSTPVGLKPQPADAPIPGIPTLAQAIFDKLMSEPLREAQDMRREVALYLGVIESAAETNPYVDNILGREIARVCDALLAAVDDDTPAHTKRQIQAAARYFVTEEDGDSDLAIGGLDEDAAVANAVAEHLGRGDLVSDLL